MAERKLKNIKLSKSEMKGLHEAMVFAHNNYTSLSDYEVLLFYHLKLLGRDFNKKLNNDQSYYGIRLTEIQAFAFRLIWAPVDLSEVGFEANVIQRILDEINAYFTNKVAIGDTFQ